MTVCIEPAKRGDSIKPGGGAKRNPRESLEYEGEAQESGRQRFITTSLISLALSHASRARFSCVSLSWGSASLHPRLYALTRYAGFEKERSTYLLGDSSILNPFVFTHAASFMYLLA